jgi:hypothetical protein
MFSLGHAQRYGTVPVQLVATLGSQAIMLSVLAAVVDRM